MLAALHYYMQQNLQIYYAWLYKLTANYTNTCIHNLCYVFSCVGDSMKENLCPHRNSYKASLTYCENN